MANVELLAPAGDFESFYAAINNGADAIYLGLSNFNARAKAPNFTLENISQVVSYAHLYNVKIYVTINTLIKDEETLEFIDMIKECQKAKVDAYIIQDFGVVELFKKYFPNAIMHASTQMGIHNLEGAKVASKLGFKRVVLSRETTLEDIKEIRANTELELEYFVQGALCVSFSGNCYMSSMISGYSGNRGKCEQFCRKKYLAIADSKEELGYHLSARDLCLANELKNLVDAGIMSFKIEGRLRRPGYVAISVATYKTIIENDFAPISEEQMQNLKTSFSRGEYNYSAYLHNEKSNIINEKVSNHAGIKIGTLKSFRRFKDNLYELEIVSNHVLHTGDGLKMFNNQKEVMSLGVGNVIDKGHNTYKIFTTQRPVMTNLDVHLILNSEVEKRYLSHIKKVPLQVRVIAKINKPLCIIMSTDKYKIRAFSDSILEKAQKHPLTEDEIKEQVNKLKDTPFVMQEFHAELEDVFATKSVINELRRKAISMLLNKYNEVEFEEIKVEDKKEELNSLMTFSSAICFNEDNGLSNLAKEYDGLLVYAPKVYDEKVLSRLEELKTIFVNAKIAINLPIIATSQDLKVLRSILKKCHDYYVVANNIYGLSFINTHNVIAGVGLNLNNNQAINLVKKLGVSGVILGYESEKNFAKSNKDCLVYALGLIPLMNLTHCPYQHIYKCTCSNCAYERGLAYQDEMKKSYQIRRSKVQTCHFELLNYRVYNLLNKVENNVFIDLRNLNNEKEVISALTMKKDIKFAEEFSGLFFRHLA